ncbi:ribbon-helix-helix domain-containing protein [Patescibacteria group bacterium]|nr:ribbon-helix-helix domain-containing protein [Patescibacteria group bacterium]MBU1015895.1 ribbon-helix-helix domain-containing protein [Patescibacteria group bacterium]MBU1685064.1 ribbon-helix-helix domain-containing protein [Patescibacteria group bacterium]MBU1938173.1 ribbon-helix-helix domain-containing protein [Patescibacteria group bacterium]
MKRVHFFIYDELAGQINEAINRWGFNSQSEFFRYLAMDFIRNEKKLLTTDDTLKDHTKAIRMIKTNQRKTFMDPQS